MKHLQKSSTSLPTTKWEVHMLAVAKNNEAASASEKWPHAYMIVWLGLLRRTWTANADVRTGVQSWSVLSPLRWWPSRRGSDSVRERLRHISHSLPLWIWIFPTNGADLFSAVLLAQLSHRFISCKLISLFYHLLSRWSPITVLFFCLSSWPPAVHHRRYLSSFPQYFSTIQTKQTQKLKSCLHINLYLFFAMY